MMPSIDNIAAVLFLQCDVVVLGGFGIKRSPIRHDDSVFWEIYAVGKFRHRYSTKLEDSEDLGG